MLDGFTRLVGRNVLVAGLIAAAMAAIGASVEPLVVRGSASALGCVDVGCNSHQKCKDNDCDVCHTDNRCGLVPEIE